MPTSTSSKFLFATLILTSAGLVGCNTNQTSDASETEDSDLLSMKKDSDQMNRGADQAGVYSAPREDYPNQQNQQQQQQDQQQQEADDVVASSMQEMSPISQTITFEFDSAELTPEAKETLRNAFEESQRSIPMEAEVIGYTDDQGPESYNRELSEKRAQAVRDYIASLDANVEEWQVEGRGEQSPTAPNDTRDGRAENRRVSITLRPMEQTSQEGGV